ncbi:MAG TPA: ABC transporter ATP-binding protein/permease [Rhizobiaceae bacterium]|nr:ABC transporter ATP-binding protein/permease [Rhizobiaceae bacterium]
MALTSDEAATKAAAPVGLRRQLDVMLPAFLTSPVRNTIVYVALAALFVIAAMAAGQVILNRWYQPFYDAIERRDLPAFFDQLMIFAVIASGLLVLNVSQTWLNQRMRLKLREGLTLDLIGEWLEPRRAFRIAKAGDIGVNPDQRMQQDAGHLADLTTDLGFGLLQSSVLLASFVGVLWSLSSGFVFNIGGRSFEIPGYMVWAALIYTGTASWLSWLVGRRLIGLNSERYAREADLRFSMMRVNENIDAITLAAGEAEERRRLRLDLATLLDAVRGIFRAQINLAWVTSGYGWVTVVAPILVASPIYFAGDLTFGGLMMAVGAFNQVHTSLRWFIDNIGVIADWRATLMRVSVFRIALVGTDVLHDKEKRIEFAVNDAEALTFDHLEIASPGGCSKLVDQHVEIGAGERVTVTGDPNAGKTLFFRMLAGLWPWGSGRVGMPASGSMFFVPRVPYFPPGRLRDVLSYPQADSTFADADLAAALTRVGLDRLAGSLERSARWDRELNEDEQRLLALARVRLHRPRWVIVDEVFDALGSEASRRALSIFQEELRGTAVVGIGRADRSGHFFTRVIHIEKDMQGRKLKPIRLPDGDRRMPVAAQG